MCCRNFAVTGVIFFQPIKSPSNDPPTTPLRATYISMISFYKSIISGAALWLVLIIFYVACNIHDFLIYL